LTAKRNDSAPDIDAIVAILRGEVAGLQVPVVTEFSRKRRNPFDVLISTILSLRTKDEVTRVAARRLLDRASTPEAILDLPEEEIAKLIFPVGFYKTKARTLRQVCRDLIDRYHGKVPDDIDELLTLKGVGRKTANLVVTLGYGKLGVCVDTHVHRVSNRLGYVKTKTRADRTSASTEASAEVLDRIQRSPRHMGPEHLRPHQSVLLEVRASPPLSSSRCDATPMKSVPSC